MKPHIHQNPQIEAFILQGDHAGDVDITGNNAKETALNFRKALNAQLSKSEAEENNKQ